MDTALGEGYAVTVEERVGSVMDVLLAGMRWRGRDIREALDDLVLVADVATLVPGGLLRSLDLLRARVLLAGDLRRFPTG